MSYESTGHTRLVEHRTLSVGCELVQFKCCFSVTSVYLLPIVRLFACRMPQTCLNTGLKDLQEKLETVR